MALVVRKRPGGSVDALPWSNADAPETKRLIADYVAMMRTAARLRAALDYLMLAPDDARRCKTAGWGDADRDLAEAWGAAIDELERDADAELPR